MSIEQGQKNVIRLVYYMYFERRIFYDYEFLL